MRESFAIRLALGVSILVHALLFSIPTRDREAPPPPAGVQGPLTVRLEPFRAPEAPAIEPPATQAAAEPRPRRTPLAMPPRVLPTPPAQTTILPRVLPEPSVEAARPPRPVPAPERPFDMSELIAANRERRRAREAAMARGPSAPPGAPSDAGAESLSRNLASLSRGDDTGGVFRILRIGARTAEFSFNGWTTESRRTWHEVIEVDAGPGGNVERAVVRRMIALIREHYAGDFNWESRRTGRVVVLSAAPERNDELEEYLMREFFETPLMKRGP